MHDIARKAYNRETSFTEFITVQRCFSSTVVERLFQPTKYLMFGDSIVWEMLT